MYVPRAPMKAGLNKPERIEKAPSSKQPEHHLTDGPMGSDRKDGPQGRIGDEKKPGSHDLLSDPPMTLRRCTLLIHTHRLTGKSDSYRVATVTDNEPRGIAPDVEQRGPGVWTIRQARSVSPVDSLGRDGLFDCAAGCTTRRAPWGMKA